MAIERNPNTTYSHDTPMEPGDDESGADSGSETTEIPTSMLEGQEVQPGDVIRLEVVANNEDSGSVTVKYAQPKTAGSAIDKAASQFEG